MRTLRWLVYYSKLGRRATVHAAVAEEMTCWNELIRGGRQHFVVTLLVRLAVGLNVSPFIYTLSQLSSPPPIPQQVSHFDIFTM